MFLSTLGAAVAGYHATGGASGAFSAWAGAILCNFMTEFILNNIHSLPSTIQYKYMYEGGLMGLYVYTVLSNEFSKVAEIAIGDVVGIALYDYYSLQNDSYKNANNIDWWTA